MKAYDLIAKVEEINEKLCSDNPELVREGYDELTLVDAEVDEMLPWYAKLSKNLELEADGLKAESERLAKLAKSRYNAVERIKQAVFDVMAVTGREKVKTDIGTFSIQKNPAKVVVRNLEEIPESYLIPSEPTVDKKGILQAYKFNGEIIPGTEVVQEMGLRFR